MSVRNAAFGRTLDRLLGGIINRYLLSLAARPFLGTLAIVLPALLMERLLRLFDLVASEDVPALSVVRMLVDLLPHYLGLALPAALFVGIYAVVAKLSADNEMDALQNTGMSLFRMSRPFLFMGVVASLLGLGLYGEVQPLSRYAYRAAFQAATQGSWDATVVPGELIRVSRHLMVTADKVNRFGGRLSRVLIDQRGADGAEKLTTARTGRIQLSRDGSELSLVLHGATQLETRPGREPGSTQTPIVSLDRPFNLLLARFRPRGADEREMTSHEIARAEKHPTAALPLHRLQAEWNARLARALALLLMPVLAVPLGLSAKRARRQYGLVVGIVLLVLFFHLLQLAQSLGSAGLADARPAIWAVMAVFAALSVWLFHRAGRDPGRNPIDPLLSLLERLRPPTKRRAAGAGAAS